MKINDIEYNLTKVVELSGVHAVWCSDDYRIYATPYHEGIPVPVDVRDNNENEIGLDSYPAEVESFDRYCKVVKTLAEKIIRRSKM